MKWKEEWLEKLNILPSKELAELVGCSLDTVYTKRRQMKTIANETQKSI
jgi:DNA-binding CsgD family transcriptional regulator